MPVFEYTALDRRGKKVSGVLDAEGQPGARNRLRATGVYPVALRQVAPLRIENRTADEHPSGLFTRKVKPVELALATRQLATLLGASFPLVSALGTLLPQTPSAPLQRRLAQIKDDVTGGSSFADALARAPDTFPPFFINMVRAGESSGTLEIVLNRLADVTERQQSFQASVRNALTYPILMLVVGTAVLVFLLTYVVPSITGIFAEMNQVLPLPTRLLLAFSAAIRHYGWAIPLMIVGLWLGLRRLRSTRAGRTTVDRWLLQLPLVGDLIRRLNTARVARTFGSLLENGVAMLSAIAIVRNIAGNVIIAEALDGAALEVGQGKALAAALKSRQALPSLAVQMIDVGEQSGQLEAMLGKIADMYESEVEASVMRLTTLLEPLMILFLGAAVAFVVLAHLSADIRDEPVDYVGWGFGGSEG